PGSARHARSRSSCSGVLCRTNGSSGDGARSRLARPATVPGCGHSTPARRAWTRRRCGQRATLTHPCSRLCCPRCARGCPRPRPPPPAGDDPQARFGLLASVSAFLRRVAQHDCLVVVLEDLHWADEASLQLLTFVARARSPAGEPITLRGLGHGEVEALVGHATVSPPQPSLVARLHQLTDGNPFFLDEVLRVLRDDGRLGDGSAFDEPVPLPESVRDTVRLRLDPLAAEDRDLLSVAAVGGREVDLGVLHRP